MTNGGSVTNGDSFERKLDELASGFGTKQQSMVNKAAADKFKDVLLSDDRVPFNDKTTGTHLRDGFLVQEKKNGTAVVGFTAESSKGYIARLLNDGWTPVGPKHRGKENNNQPVAGKHFWEKTIKEAKTPIRKVMSDKVKQIMDKG